MGGQRPKEAVELRCIGKGLYKIVVHDQEAVREAAREALRIPGEELRRPPEKPAGLRARLRLV